jgi:hypothetical protein
MGYQNECKICTYVAYTCHIYIPSAMGANSIDFEGVVGGSVSTGTGRGEGEAVLMKYISQLHAGLPPIMSVVDGSVVSVVDGSVVSVVDGSVVSVVDGSVLKYETLTTFLVAPLSMVKGHYVFK